MSEQISNQVAVDLRLVFDFNELSKELGNPDSVKTAYLLSNIKPDPETLVDDIKTSYIKNIIFTIKDMLTHAELCSVSDNISISNIQSEVEDEQVDEQAEEPIEVELAGVEINNINDVDLDGVIAKYKESLSFNEDDEITYYAEEGLTRFSTHKPFISSINNIGGDSNILELIGTESDFAKRYPNANIVISNITQKSAYIIFNNLSREDEIKTGGN